MLKAPPYLQITKAWWPHSQNGNLVTSSMLSCLQTHQPLLRIHWCFVFPNRFRPNHLSLYRFRDWFGSVRSRFEKPQTNLGLFGLAWIRPSHIRFLRTTCHVYIDLRNSHTHIFNFVLKRVLPHVMRICSRWNNTILKY